MPKNKHLLEPHLEFGFEIDHYFLTGPAIRPSARLFVRAFLC